MPIIIPLLIILGAGLIGAAYTARTFARVNRSPQLGAIIGALGGGIGSLLFMLPLDWCTFYFVSRENIVDRTFADLLLGVLLVAIGMVIVLVPINWFIAHWTTGTLLAGQPTQGMFKGRILPFVFLAPTLIILVLFLYYPFLDNFRLSTLLTGRGALLSGRSRFVCVANFTDLAYDPAYFNSVLATFIIAGAIIIIGLAISLLIAVMAYQPVKGATIYRTLLVWPYALSAAVAGVIFGMMFDPAAGIINYFTDNIFGVKFPWLQNGGLAILAVILTSVWHTISFNILFYIAGLQNIPGDLLEAAAIDGANLFQRFWRITVPMLSPITFFLIITNMTYSFFDIFGTIDYLTGGGPLKATTVMIYNIYEKQRETIGLGQAAAQSILLFILVIGLTVVQFRTTNRRVTYGA